MGVTVRKRRRFMVLTLLASVLSTLTAAINPSVASASVPCPADIAEWKGAGSNHGIIQWTGLQYTLISATPQFMVSDGRLLDNGLDSPAQFQVTSSVSQTFSIAATVGVTANPDKVKNYFNLNVSTTITASRTTMIGVSVTTTVPPHSRVIAEYGVQGYLVTYAVSKYFAVKAGFEVPPPGYPCEEQGYFPQSTIAPTNTEGWRLRAG